MLLIQQQHLNELSITRYGVLLTDTWEMFWTNDFDMLSSQGGVCISKFRKMGNMYK